MPHVQATYLLVGSVIAAFIGTLGFYVTPLLLSESTILLELGKTTYLPEEQIVVVVQVVAQQPVNVFSGEVQFDDELLQVESISYNTELAQLWAEKPWYDNGAGTVNFAGGTTNPGGFTGSDTLLTITFTSRQEGVGSLSVANGRLLLHNGLGSDATLPEPIDTIVTIAEVEPVPTAVVASNQTSRTISIMTPALTDLNQDGKTSLADVSMFMFDLSTQNPRSDLNGDGLVNTKDLSVLLEAL